jgi:hypothetical protein
VHVGGRGQEGHQGYRAGGGRDRSQTEEVGRLSILICSCNSMVLD